MLLLFKMKNYKSFREETAFSMTAAPRQTGLDYCIMHEKIGQKQYAGLSSAIIYGPNASGKTNLIGAMDTMRAILLRGNIRNADVIATPNQAAYMLEFIPNSHTEDAPTSFFIRFIEKGMLFEYSFAADLGSFLDKDAPRSLIEESLSINNKQIYLRKYNSLKMSIKSLPKGYLKSSVLSDASINALAESSLNTDELFLCNGFKTIFSKEIFAVIQNWFENKFIVIYRSDAIRLMKRFADPRDKTIYVEKTLNDIATAFGITSNALGYRMEDDDSVLCSIFKDKKIAIPAEDFESYGTIRLVTEFPLIIRAFLTGATLVMDEFDASIHPIALMSIINLFHNDDINKLHAQFVFNTHNPIFLNASLFRRDEIKFVERDDETGFSTHYALSDFKTAQGIRKGEDYMSNYFVSRYGAIKNIDFSPIMEEIMTSAVGESNDE